MFCKNCGTQLKEGAVFCTNCGTKIAPVGQDNTEGIQEAEVYYEQSVRTGKPLQGPVIMAAALIVVLAGCLVTVFVLRGRDADQDVKAQDIILEEDDAEEDDSGEKPDEGQELSDEEEEDRPQESQTLERAEDVSRYILPNSDSAYLSLSDLTGLTKEECRLARNELYARHGRRFDDEGLQNYFNGKDWYTGYIDPADFSDSVLNDYEMANRDLIVQYEEEMGYR